MMRGVSFDSIKAWATFPANPIFSFIFDHLLKLLYPVSLLHLFHPFNDDPVSIIQS